MSVNVIRWQLPEGGEIPKPIFIDDRVNYPPDLVKNILAWLELQKPKFLAARKPTDQIVHLVNPEVNRPAAKAEFIGGSHVSLPGAQGLVKFEAGTFELILREKQNRMPLVKYHFLHARNRANGDCIVGPELWSEVVGRIG